MTDLRVLYLGKNDETRLFRESYVLREKLKTLCHVDEHGWGFKNVFGGNNKTCEHDLKVLYDEFKPDVVLIYSRKNETWHNADKVDVPKAIIMTDPHGKRLFRANWINRVKIDMTLFRTIGADKLAWWKENLFEGHDIVWLPQSCDTESMRDLELERIYDFVLLGRAHKSTYPLRAKIYSWLGYASPTDVRHPDFKVFHARRHKRTYGWTEKKRRRVGVIGGEDYVVALNEAKIMPTGASGYRYAVSKCFEPTGTGTALAINSAGGLEGLGFIPDHNYIDIDHDNFKEKLVYYLENDSERKKITDNAKVLMHTKHSTKIRARELLGHLESLL